MTPRGCGWLFAAVWSLGWWTFLAWCVAGCAGVDPEVASALAAYDRAEAMGLVAPRIERPYARITDGAPWTHSRGVEIAR